MPPVEQLGGKAWTETMNRIDPEVYKHVAGVYGTWTAKPWIVQHAKDLNVYNSEYFFWVSTAASMNQRAADYVNRSTPAASGKAAFSIISDRCRSDWLLCTKTFRMIQLFWATPTFRGLLEQNT